MFLIISWAETDLINNFGLIQFTAEINSLLILIRFSQNVLLITLFMRNIDSMLGLVLKIN